MVEINEVIRHVLPIYLTLAETAWDINNGLCEPFGVEVIRLMGGEHDGLFGQWITHDGNDHFVLIWNGRYYDAEHPDGVDDIYDLSFIMNSGKTRLESIGI